MKKIFGLCLLGCLLAGFAHAGEQETIDFRTKKMHEGKMYRGTEIQVLAAAATAYWVIDLTTVTVNLHAKFHVSIGTHTGTVTIFEDVAASTDSATAITPRNINRASSDTPTTIRAIFSKDAIITSAGTTIETYGIYQTNNEILESSIPSVLSQGKKYSIVVDVINDEGVSVTLRKEYYEQ